MTPPLLVLFCRRPNAGSPIQGLNTAAPLCCTSCTLRVTRCMSCSSAVAASIVSITGGVCPVARLTAPLIAPHRCTRASLTGGSWPANRASSAASAASIRGRMAPCRAGWPARPPRWCPAAGRSQGDIAAEITLAFDAHLPKPQPLKERDQRLLRRRGRQQARQLLDGDHHDGVLAAHHHVLRTVGARPRAHQQQTLPARLPQSCQKLFWPGVEPRQSRYLNNRAEVSHQSTRRRERQMQRFKSAHHAQRFLSTLRARPEINALIRSKISEPYQGVKVIEFDHLSPDDPLAGATTTSSSAVIAFPQTNTAPPGTMPSARGATSPELRLLSRSWSKPQVTGPQHTPAINLTTPSPELQQHQARHGRGASVRLSCVWGLFVWWHRVWRSYVRCRSSRRGGVRLGSVRRGCRRRGSSRRGSVWCVWGLHSLRESRHSNRKQQQRNGNEKQLTHRTFPLDLNENTAAHGVLAWVMPVQLDRNQALLT